MKVDSLMPVVSRHKCDQQKGFAVLRCPNECTQDME